MKIGFFGGTFDPIHLGHFSLAVNLKEARQLDQIWFCPAAHNPFKEKNGGTPVEHRLAMTRLATAHCPFIRVIDTEAKRKGPSYTIDTLKQLQKEHPDHQFFLLLGEDSLEGFEQWKSAEELVRTFPVYTGTRFVQKKPHFKNKVIEKEISAGLTLLPRFDISATDVRERLKKRAFCGHLVNQEVLDYISKHRLY